MLERAASVNSQKTNSYSHSPEGQQHQIEDIRRLAKTLDAQFELPFGIKVGWDAIVGLIPVFGIGDVATSGLSLYILFRGAQVGCSVSVLLRMAINILIDVALGVFPFLGAVADIFWRSNQRNIALIEQSLARPNEINRKSKWWVLLVFSGLALVLLSLISLLVFLALKVWGYLSTSMLGSA